MPRKTTEKKYIEDTVRMLHVLEVKDGAGRVTISCPQGDNRAPNLSPSLALYGDDISGAYHEFDLSDTRKWFYRVYNWLCELERIRHDNPMVKR